MTGETFQTDLPFKCPFCGADCETVKPAGVLHALPACQGFIDLDPVQFLQAVNRAARLRN